MLAQAQVRAHTEGARAIVAAKAPVSGGGKAALKVAVARKMAALARKDTLQLHAPAGLLLAGEGAAMLAGEATARKQALSLVPGWAGLGGHKKKKAKSTGLKVPPAPSRPSPTTLNLRYPPTLEATQGQILSQSPTDTTLPPDSGGICMGVD